MFRVAASLVLFVSGVYAQQESGSITGQVVDPADAGAPKAPIRVVNEDTGAVFATTSDIAGFYRAPQVAPGSYTITVATSGFATLIRRGILVRVNDRLRIDLRLQ